MKRLCRHEKNHRTFITGVRLFGREYIDWWEGR